MDRSECFEDYTDVSMPETQTAFVFSKPSVLPDSPKPFEFLQSLQTNTFDASANEKSAFTFAVPVSAVRDELREEFDLGSAESEKQYKPKIERNAYKASANVFARALKDTAVFEQLKKNAKSQPAKISLENCITCSCVPSALLTKAAAKKYFFSFGTIVRIAIRPKKQTILVAYATKEEATNAYSNGGEYMGEKFNVEWTKSCASPKTATKKKDTQKNVSDLLRANDNDDVKSELEALAGLEYTLYGSSREAKEVTPSKKKKAPHSKTVAKAAAKPKKAASKSEKHEPDSQISDLLPNTSVEELRSIIHQAALSSEDKYKVLEARDRLMRLKQVKAHTLATAKATSGTCPDMCPEKERLWREAKRQVALYEQLEGSDYRINHLAAIKEYSRSSADQEEPMAHELRPVKSLKMTMSYLLHEIANLCDEPGTNLKDWYDFLWNRMRAIRKDITQQELCCIETVELVEQCARFHIICSERLCAEDSFVFDKKMNSDNLTKCLQSLKYMYHDLRVKGVACKNEPEFRTYIILLNLNNGNFMWDLQRLPRSIQESPEVQFALDVYSALESNNYYKFFKLVRRTTYLNACILLRYFNQVRMEAMLVMVKAYRRTTSTAYPLYELIDILGFEDENEAIYFCEQIGLNVSQDELYILLNRQNLHPPMLTVKQNRACNLIESKRTIDDLTIGECIAGGKLPERMYKYHKPHTSFDSRGYLKPESVNAQDQNPNAQPAALDPYEFIDEDSTKSEEPILAMESKQESKPESKSESKPEKKSAPMATVAQSSMFTAASTFASVPDVGRNIFARAKTETIPPFTSKSSVEGANETKSQATLTFDTATEKGFEIKPSMSVAGTQESSTSSMTSTGTVNFGSSVFSMPPVGSKSTNVFAKPAVPASNETPSPFAMAASKQIFSGSAQKNLFARSTPSTNIFGNSGTSVESDAKPSTPSGSGRTDRKAKDVPSFGVKKETTPKSTAQEVEAERQRLKELERAKRKQKVNEDAAEILDELQKEIIEACCSAIAKEELEIVRTYVKLSEDIADETTEEVLLDMCNGILAKEIADQRKLGEMSMRMKNRVVLKYFRVWRQYVYKKRRQREALDNTPVWLQRQSVEECAKLLYTEQQNITVRNMCRRLEEQQVLTKSYADSLAPIEVIIHAGIKENLNSLYLENPFNFFWKVVISWPDLQNKTLLWYHKKIMNQYLCPENFTTEPMISVYQPNQFETIHVCIRHFEGLISDHNLLGTDAFLFIAAASEDAKFVSRRLTKTVLSQQKLMPLPLAVIVLGEGNLENQSKSLVSDLESLLDSGYLSEYTIMYEKNLNERTILNLTQSAILWLAVNKSPPNPLEMNYLQDVYDTCITEELWLRILGDASFNTKLSYALHEPNFVISLHNEAITHLMDILLDPESFMYSKFSPELRKFLPKDHRIPCSYEYFDDSWKAEDYKAELESTMSNFLLPKWEYSWPIENEETLFEHALYYCEETLPDITRAEISSGLTDNLFFAGDASPPPSFIDILLHVVKEKVRSLDPELRVIYNRNHVKHFRTLPWWFKSNALTEFKLPAEVLDPTVKEGDRPRSKRRRVKLSEEVEREEARLYQQMEPLARFCEDTRSMVMEVQRTSTELEDRLRSQQRENLLLEKKLKDALLGESDIPMEL